MVKLLKNVILLLVSISLIFLMPICNADELEKSIQVINLKVYNQNIETKTKNFKIGVPYAVLIDFESGRVLYEKNARNKVPMASTTKIMTAIVAIENSDLNDMVEVSKRAALVGGSQIKIVKGQKYSMNDLLNGLLINSGNDAAIAIAEHVGGSVEIFLNMMNEKAKELGAYNTQFKSPHGLDIPGHYSTAYDLAVITRYALENKTFSRIVSSKSAWFPTGILNNTNELLSLYEGADGVKTGYTGLAGRCLVASATRNKMKLISVVLNAPTKTERARSSKVILDYGFANYHHVQLATMGEKVTDLKVYRGRKDFVTAYVADDCKIPLTTYEKTHLKKEFVPFNDIMKAPTYSGDEVGKLVLSSNGKIIVKLPVIINESMRKLEWIDYFTKIISAWSIKNGKVYKK
jgi:D-alanyl-D-alanine carboxypeptidase (penicillin-binding protein 5/6)